MTTAALSVRLDSSRLVSWSISSRAPWAEAKNDRTCWRWPTPSVPGSAMPSTKKR